MLKIAQLFIGLYLEFESISFDDCKQWKSLKKRQYCQSYEENRICLLKHIGESLCTCVGATFRINRSLSTKVVPRIKIYQMYFKSNSNAVRLEREMFVAYCCLLLATAHGFRND